MTQAKGSSRSVELMCESLRTTRPHCVAIDNLAASVCRANGTCELNSIFREPKSHFARIRDIVNETDLLIACPQHMDPITESTLGGTAHTLNFARRKGKPIVIVRPDGSIEREGQSRNPD